MSTINQKIKDIKAIFKSIADAIKEKGVEVGECDLPSSYAGKILEIKGGGVIPITSVECKDSVINCDYKKQTINVVVTYVNCDKINNPIVNGDWITIFTNDTDNTRQYTIELTENSYNKRSDTIVFSCEGNGEAAHHLIINQDSKPADEPDIKKPVITISNEILYFVPTGGAQNIIVQYENGEGQSPKVSEDWCKINSNTITVKENKTEDIRSCIITFSCSNELYTTEKNIFVIQQSYSDATIDIEGLPTTLSYEEGEYNYSVTYTNADSIQIVSDSEWLQINEFKLSVNENIGSQRSAKLTFSCVGKNGKTVTKERTITQNTAITSIVCDPAKEIVIDCDTPFAIISAEYNNYTSIENPVVPDWINTEFYVEEENLRVYKFIINDSKNENREGEITFKCTGLSGLEKEKTITIVQQIIDVDIKPQSSPMYYGYIPFIKGVSPTGYDKITGDYILQCVEDGTITKVDQATTMGKTSFGVVPKYSMLLIAVPSDSGLVATMDDGDNAKVKFDSTTPNSNGEYTVTIDGIAYGLYGQYAPFDLPNESTFFYID